MGGGKGIIPFPAKIGAPGARIDGSLGTRKTLGALTS